MNIFHYYISALIGGEEVSVYTLQDSDPSTLPPCWSTQGMSALLQPLSSEEGSLDGGLCLGCRALCTWAENDVLRTGLVYVVKAFKPEVVRVWQRYFPGDTALQLCLRVSINSVPTFVPIVRFILTYMMTK